MRPNRFDKDGLVDRMGNVILSSQMNILEQAGIGLVDELDRKGDFCRLRVFRTSIGGLMIFEKGIRRDERGEFSELRLPDVRRYVGVNFFPQQLNDSLSVANVERGMHVEDQHKLVGALNGEIIGAWVDTRVGSSSFGVVQRLVGMDHRYKVFVPEGVANGFGVVSPGVVNYGYTVSKTYDQLDPSKQVAISLLSAFRGYPNGLFPEILKPIISDRDGKNAISWEEFELNVRGSKKSKNR